MEYILTETLHYFKDSLTGRQFLTKDGETFYSQSRNKVMNEKLLKRLQEAYAETTFVKSEDENGI